MKTLIYQYWYGSEPKESALAGKKNMESYAKFIGSEYLFAKDPEFYGGPCSREKKYSALRPVYDDKFLEYDKVMYLDLDVFAVDGCKENIFEENIEFIGICPEPDQPELRTIPGVAANKKINNKNDEVWARAVRDKYGVDINRDEKNRPMVYNSGVVVFTREGLVKARQNFVQFNEHIKHLSSAGLKEFYLSDQTYYQTMLHVSGIPFTILDPKWNSQIHYRRDGGLRVHDCRTDKTNFVHVQISGADNMDTDAHYRMVNLPVKDWNI